MEKVRAMHSDVDILSQALGKHCRRGTVTQCEDVTFWPEDTRRQVRCGYARTGCHRGRTVSVQEEHVVTQRVLGRSGCVGQWQYMYRGHFKERTERVKGTPGDEQKREDREARPERGCDAEGLHDKQP